MAAFGGRFVNSPRSAIFLLRLVGPLPRDKKATWSMGYDAERAHHRLSDLSKNLSAWSVDVVLWWRGNLDLSRYWKLGEVSLEHLEESGPVRLHGISRKPDPEPTATLSKKHLISLTPIGLSWLAPKQLSGNREETSRPGYLHNHVRSPRNTPQFGVA